MTSILLARFANEVELLEATLRRSRGDDIRNRYVPDFRDDVAKMFREQGEAFRVLVEQARKERGYREAAPEATWFTEPKEMLGYWDEAEASLNAGHVADFKKNTSGPFYDGIARGQLDVATAFALENEAAQNWLAANAAAKVAGINKTTRVGINALLTHARGEGWSYDKLGRTLRSRFAGMGAKRPQGHIIDRAMLIAVNETGWAYESGTLAHMMEVQKHGILMEKSLLTVGDKQTCPECDEYETNGWVAVESDLVPLAPIHPACRCTMLYQQSNKLGQQSSRSLDANFATKADHIRALLKQGMSKSQVAKATDASYSQVHSIAKKMGTVKPAPAPPRVLPKPAPAPAAAVDDVPSWMKDFVDTEMFEPNLFGASSRQTGIGWSGTPDIEKAWAAYRKRVFAQMEGQKGFGDFMYEVQQWQYYEGVERTRHAVERVMAGTATSADDGARMMMQAIDGSEASYRTVYRGLSGIDPSDMSKMRVGEVFDTKMASWTDDLGVAREYGDDVVLHMSEESKGIYVSSFGENHGFVAQREFVTNGRFRIKNVDILDGVMHVEVEQLATLKPPAVVPKPAYAPKTAPKPLPTPTAPKELVDLATDVAKAPYKYDAASAKVNPGYWKKKWNETMEALTKKHDRVQLVPGEWPAKIIKSEYLPNVMNDWEILRGTAETWQATMAGMKQVRAWADDVLRGAFMPDLAGHRGTAGLLQLIDNAPASVQKVYRGMFLADENVAGVVARFKKGSTHDWALTSFTESSSIAERFVTMGRATTVGDGVELVVSLEKGAKGIHVGALGRQSKFLNMEEFLTGGRFRVVDVTTEATGRVRRVHVTVRQQATFKLEQSRLGASVGKAAKSQTGPLRAPTPATAPKPVTPTPKPVVPKPVPKPAPAPPPPPPAPAPAPVFASKADHARHLLGQGQSVSQVAKSTGASYSQVHGIAKKMGKVVAKAKPKPTVVAKAKPVAKPKPTYDFKTPRPTTKRGLEGRVERLFEPIKTVQVGPKPGDAGSLGRLSTVRPEGFIAAKTKTEARRRLMDSGLFGKMGPSRIPLESLNDVLAEVELLKRRGVLSKLKVNLTFKTTPGSNGTHVGYGLVNPGQAASSINLSPGARWGYGTSRNLGETFVHEFGHAVSNNYARYADPVLDARGMRVVGNKSMQVRMKTRERLFTAWDEALQAERGGKLAPFQETVKHIGEEVSAYASKSAKMVVQDSVEAFDELFAEHFALMLRPGYVRGQFPKAVEDVVLDIIKQGDVIV